MGTSKARGRKRLKMRKINLEMEKIDLGKHQPSCMLAHRLINQLSVIVGHCDLIKEIATEHPKCLARLSTIREVAKAMAKELNEHQCEIDVLTRDSVRGRPQAQDASAEKRA